MRGTIFLDMVLAAFDRGWVGEIASGGDVQRKRCVWPDCRDSNSLTGARIMRYEVADYEWTGSAPVRRLRAEADINLPTIPDESVENDPERHFTRCPA